MPTQPAFICLKNPNLYAPKQRNGSIKEPVVNQQKVFEIKELDVNNGIMKAEAMLRKESQSAVRSSSKVVKEIPHSAK